MHTSFSLDSMHFIKEASPFPTDSVDTHANWGMTCRQRCKQYMPLIARTNDSSAWLQPRCNLELARTRLSRDHQLKHSISIISRACRVIIWWSLIFLAWYRIKTQVLLWLQSATIDRSGGSGTRSVNTNSQHNERMAAMSSSMTEKAPHPILTPSYHHVCRNKKYFKTVF